MALFKPAWQSDNEEKALKAVKREADQNKLAEIAENATNSIVSRTAFDMLNNQTILLDITLKNKKYRADAIKKLTDQSVILSIALNHPDNYIRATAIHKLTDKNILEKIAMSNSEDKLAAAFALNEQGDRAMLIYIATSDKSVLNRQNALALLTDESIIADIAKTDEDWKVRKNAIERLTDQTLLTDIAINNEGNESKIAIEKITDRSRLIDVAQKAKSASIRFYAAVKLDDENIIKKACYDIVTNSAYHRHGNYKDIMLNAASRLTDQALLADCAKKPHVFFDYNRHGVSEIVRAVFNNLTSQEMLVDVANNSEDTSFRIAAVEKLADKALLVDYVKNSPDAGIRLAAAKNLPEREGLGYIAQNDKDNLARKQAIEIMTDQSLLSGLANDSDTEKYSFEYAETLRTGTDDDDFAYGSKTSTFDFRNAARDRLEQLRKK
jgi:hypothetical protein